MLVLILSNKLTYICATTTTTTTTKIKSELNFLNLSILDEFQF